MEVIDRADQLVLPTMSMEQVNQLFKEAFPNIPEQYSWVLDMESNRPRNFDYPYDREDPNFCDWYRTCCTFNAVIPLADFKKFNEAYMVDNFIYHRRMRVIFGTLTPAHHSNFMAHLYTLEQLNRGIKPNRTDKNLPFWYHDYQSEASDRFVMEGLGLYQSSCSRDVYRHREFRLDGQEKMAFSNSRITEFRN